MIYLKIRSAVAISSNMNNTMQCKSFHVILSLLEKLDVKFELHVHISWLLPYRYMGEVPYCQGIKAILYLWDYLCHRRLSFYLIILQRHKQYLVIWNQPYQKSLSSKLYWHCCYGDALLNCKGSLASLHKKYIKMEWHCVRLWGANGLLRLWVPHKTMLY